MSKHWEKNNGLEIIKTGKQGLDAFVLGINIMPVEAFVRANLGNIFVESPFRALDEENRKLRQLMEIIVKTVT